jgi:hypothetical protein
VFWFRSVLGPRFAITHVLVVVLFRLASRVPYVPRNSSHRFPMILMFFVP